MDTLSMPAAIIPIAVASPVAYTNLYEQGDLWIKTQGCEACSWSNRQKCCGNCPLLTQGGCVYHLENPKSSRKPLHCVIQPIPTKCMSYCQLEYKCIKGSQEGKIRRVRDKGNVFQ